MHRFIDNLKISRKFMLIGLLALCAVALPMLRTIDKDWTLVNDARTKAAGLIPAGDILKLIQLTQQHRGITAGFLSGNDGLAGARQGKQVEVEQAFSKVLTSTRALGPTRLADAAGNLHEEWKQLSTRIASKSLSGPESFARHTSLIGAQMRLLGSVADRSTLSLDPESSSHHLVNAVLGHLPQVTEYLGQIRARGAVLLAKKEASVEDQLRIAALSNLVLMHADNMRHAFDKMGQDNTALKQTLAQPLAVANKAVDDGLKLVEDKIIRAEIPDYPSVEYFSATTKVIDAQFDLIGASFKLLEQVLQQRVKAKQQELVLVTGLISTLALLALWLMTHVANSTTRSLERALAVTHTVASGDLSRPIVTAGRDETGQLLSAMSDMQNKLALVVSHVRQGAENVATASAQIAQSNGDLAARTETQASALQETAAAMEELGSTVQQNAGNARQANELALHATSVAIRGGEVVAQVVSTMKDINDSSQRISDIISVIDGIAFQTNILALNAAVEAARAGEQGRGFAVVASEVRSLAGRSAEAAKEIKMLIHNSVQRVEQGSALVEHAGSTMTEVVTSIRRVTELMGQISTASAEQSAGVTQVGQAVAQLDRATQENSTVVEETASAAASLKNQAQALVGTVTVFRLGHAHENSSDQRHRPRASVRAETPQPPPVTRPSRLAGPKQPVHLMLSA